MRQIGGTFFGSLFDHYERFAITFQAPEPVVWSGLSAARLLLYTPAGLDPRLTRVAKQQVIAVVPVRAAAAGSSEGRPVKHIEVVPSKAGGPSFARHSYDTLIRLTRDLE